MANLTVALCFCANNQDLVNSKSSIEKSSIASADLKHSQSGNKYENCVFSTAAANSNDAAPIINEFLSVLTPYKSALREFVEARKTVWKIVFAGCVHIGGIPAVYLEKAFMKFCSDIHACVEYSISIAKDYEDEYDESEFNGW